MKRIGHLVGFILFSGFLVVISPLLLIVYLLYFARSMVLFVLWQCRHGGKGREFLVVYSDSPKWANFFSVQVLPLLGSRDVIVNISSTPSWKAARTLERSAHQHWAGTVEHTPIVLYFPRFGRVKSVRFYQAFLLHARQGDASKLNAKISELQALITRSEQA